MDNVKDAWDSLINSDKNPLGEILLTYMQLVEQLREAGYVPDGPWRIAEAPQDGRETGGAGQSAYSDRKIPPTARAPQGAAGRQQPERKRTLDDRAHVNVKDGVAELDIGE